MEYRKTVRITLTNPYTIITSKDPDYEYGMDGTGTFSDFENDVWILDGQYVDNLLRSLHIDPVIEDKEFSLDRDEQLSLIFRHIPSATGKCPFPLGIERTGIAPDEVFAKIEDSLLYIKLTHNMNDPENIFIQEVVYSGGFLIEWE